MPYKILRVKNSWGVKNTRTGRWKSKGTSKLKAQKQIRLLRGIKSGKWKPTE